MMPRKISFWTTMSCSVAAASTSRRTARTNSPSVWIESLESSRRYTSSMSFAGAMFVSNARMGRTNPGSPIDLHPVVPERVTVVEAHEPKSVRALKESRVEKDRRDARPALHLLEELRQMVERRRHARGADEERNVPLGIEAGEPTGHHAGQRREVVVREVDIHLLLGGGEPTLALET